METEEAAFNDDYWKGVEDKAKIEQNLAYPRHGSLTETNGNGKGFPLPEYMMKALGIEEPQTQ